MHKRRSGKRGRDPGEGWKKLWNEGPGCWPWLGCLNKVTGYGKKTWHGRDWLAHRWMYTQRVGPIPDGLVVDHTCNVRACVNPDHLQVMTQAQNVQKCYDEGRHPRKK